MNTSLKHRTPNSLHGAVLLSVAAWLCLATACTIGPRTRTTYIVVEESESGVLIIMNRKLVAEVKYDGRVNEAPDADPDEGSAVVEQNIAGYATMPRSHLRVLLDELNDLRKVVTDPVESLVEVMVD